ncbi:hypothetical protein BM527_11160 [Alteromonas sp. Mex14]|nr:hypothetical protein BM527_11160 [Alteromonas sp. Mex14]
MKKIITLKNVKHGNVTLRSLPVVVDDLGTVVLLPLLYSIHVSRNLSHFELITEVTKTSTETLLRPRSLSESTFFNSYIPKLRQFLDYVVEEYGETEMHRLYRLSANQVNAYINDYLSYRLQLNSLKTHKAAITSFFNFLSYLGVTPPRRLYVTGEARARALNNREKSKFNYVSSDIRKKMVYTCDNLRDKLILKMGYEVGLRAKELRGILIEPIKKLFSKMAVNEAKNEFSYYLPGKYTKGGKGRDIFFSRVLLEQMKDYFDKERIARDGVESFFTSMSKKSIGMPISARLGSDVFSKYLIKIEEKETGLSFQDLRHTFATELYHTELLDHATRENRSESAALLTVAERLGHAINKKDGLPGNVTKKYVRLRMKMLELEGF